MKTLMKHSLLALWLSLFCMVAFVSCKPNDTGSQPTVERITERGTYQSLADIDKPEVRVMVNPGGLNEKFANENLNQSRHKIKSTYETHRR